METQLNTVAFSVCIQIFLTLCLPDPVITFLVVQVGRTLRGRIILGYIGILEI